MEFRWPGVGYTVAQEVAIYRPGKPLKYVGPEETDFRVMTSWIFVRGGKQVALHREPLHGPPADVFELHDVETGRLVARWGGELTEKSPPWTKGFVTE